jgi:UTP:GlnB (protein PII) uridylyltransferase
VFEFADDARAVSQVALDRLLSDVVGGRVDITARLAEKHGREKVRPSAGPLLYFDNDYSQRYTVLELVADDAPGLLHRISRVLSSFGCEVELVLISTEGDKAIDVFHMRKNGAKLTDSDQLALTEHLERMLDNGSA